MTKTPYGAWIDKKGNVIYVIDEEAHAEVAIRDILKACPKHYFSYRIMFRLGYLRIVFAGQSHIAEGNKKYLTKKQNDWITSAEQFSEIVFFRN